MFRWFSQMISSGGSRQISTEVDDHMTNEGNPRGQPPNQLFNVGVDGEERDNLFGTNRAEEAALAETLDRLSGEARQHARAAERREVDSATHERLKALGYVD